MVRWRMPGVVKNYGQKKKFAGLILFGALFFIFILFITSNSGTKNHSNIIINDNSECNPDIKKEIVRGNSLAPLVNYGDEVRVDYNYYKCERKVERNDIVIYNFNAQGKRIIKTVKVVPGDTFRVNETNNTLLVNEKPMVNSRNENYTLDKQGKAMIGLYEKSFSGRLNGDVYFLFGENQASIDSSAFGPVSGSDILGKVIQIIPSIN